MKAIRAYSTYIIGAGIFFIGKYFYTITTTENLYFLLKPTNWFVKTITNSNSQYIEDSGYFYHSLDIIIDKSCSGFNFLLLCFIMLLFLAFKFIQTSNIRILAIPVLLLFAYICTIITNSSRILFSLFFEKFIATNFQTNIPWLHQAEGSFVYLLSLITIYFIIEISLLNTFKRHAQLTKP